MEVGLSQSEYDEIVKLSNVLNLDEVTTKTAISFFIDFKKRTSTYQDSPEKIITVLKCAIFLAAKAQVLTNLKGETIRGIGISVTQILKASNSSNVDDFIFTLKEYLNRVAIEKDVESDIEAIISKFSFSLKFFAKFESTFKKITFKETATLSQDYYKLLLNTGWLLFVESRTALLGGSSEILDCACILIGVLHFLVKNIAEFCYPSHFEGPIESTTERPSPKFLEKLLDVFNIKDQEYFLGSQGHLFDYLRKFVDQELNLPTKATGKNPFDPSVILQTFIRLDAHYQRSLGIDDLDERFFIKDKSAVITPSKFTPFCRQGAANKTQTSIQSSLSTFPANPLLSSRDSQSSQQGHSGAAAIKLAHAEHKNTEGATDRPYTSQRMLNYDVTESISIKSNISEIKFNSFTQPSPGLMKAMIAKTPMTTAMEMYNWMYDHVGRARSKKISEVGMALEKYFAGVEPRLRLQIFSNLDRIVDKILLLEKNDKGISHEKLKENRKNLIIALYHKALYELLSQEEKRGKTLANCTEIIQNEDYHRGLLACAIETIYFILNVNVVSFVKLIELCETSAYEFWRTMIVFVKFDASLPGPLRKHFAEIETRILSQLAWKKDSFIHQIIKSYMSPQADIRNLDDGEKESLTSFSALINKENNIANQQVSKGMGGVPRPPSKTGQSPEKSESATSQELFFKRVLHLCAITVNQLSSALNLNEKVTESVWATMKYVLTTEPDLCIDRHLDQLILCCFYSVCKVFQCPLKFQEIINKHQEIQHNNKQAYHDIIYNIDLEGGRKGDLIAFYNSAFISHLKSFILSLNTARKQTVSTSSGFVPSFKPPSPGLKKPVIPIAGMQSPLKMLLPTAMQNFPSNASTSLAQKKVSKTPLNSSMMTPKTQLLFAFGESPQVKLDHAAKNLASKKMINFDEGMGGNASVNNENINTMNVPGQLAGPQPTVLTSMMLMSSSVSGAPTSLGGNSTGSVILKKEAKYNQIPLEKIVESKTEANEGSLSSRRDVIKGKLLFGNSPGSKFNDSNSSQLNQSNSTAINTPRSHSTSNTKVPKNTSVMKQVIPPETSMSPKGAKKHEESQSSRMLNGGAGLAMPYPKLANEEKEKVEKSGSNTPEFRAAT